MTKIPTTDSELVAEFNSLISRKEQLTDKKREFKLQINLGEISTERLMNELIPEYKKNRSELIKTDRRLQLIRRVLKEKEVSCDQN